MCNCNWCKEYRQIKRITQKGDVGKLRLKVHDLFERLSIEEAEHEYLRAVMSGKWPSSVPQLKAALKNAKRIAYVKEKTNESEMRQL